LRNTPIVKAILAAVFAGAFFAAGPTSVSAAQPPRVHGAATEHADRDGGHQGHGEDNRESKHSKPSEPSELEKERQRSQGRSVSPSGGVASAGASATPAPSPAASLPAAAVPAAPRLAPAPAPAPAPALTTVAVRAPAASAAPAAATVLAGVGPGFGVLAPVAAARPARSIPPRDPEQQPLTTPLIVVFQPGFPVALAAAVGVLPLLLAIWVLVLVRIATAARREQTGRAHLALAAELGIAPVRLAGLNPEELTVLQDKVAFDELTGVMRRAGGLATLDRETARARRHATPLSVAFVDVDGLKKVNDTQGHAAGDRLLRDLVEVLSGRLRADDAIFRYGGDEFCCVLPNANLEAAARIIEDALLGALARGATFSFGVAQLQNGEDRTRLLVRADSELYKGRAARGHAGRP